MDVCAVLSHSTLELGEDEEAGVRERSGMIRIPEEIERNVVCVLTLCLASFGYLFVLQKLLQAILTSHAASLSSVL